MELGTKKTETYWKEEQKREYGKRMNINLEEWKCNNTRTSRKHFSSCSLLNRKYRFDNKSYFNLFKHVTNNRNETLLTKK